MTRISRQFDGLECGTHSAIFDRGSRIAGVRGALKRTLDIGVSAVSLVLLLPLIAVLALLIKCHDRGPVFHRRRVLGPNGEFNAFKLRTMRVDADAILKKDPRLRHEFEVNFKLKHDPRVTPLGAILRKASLDELPQLWNVLAGQMSLVGPRMITSAELHKYGDAGWIFRRFKPGITGYWQVQGRQEVSYTQRVEMDLFYVSHWSLFLDFKILFKTPIRVVRGAGAF
ncbi:MAG TPA: sugar transferase [Candidatus Angelobacter sp.]|nr:sugar transferase [Candidatus Angelobacter sp.]